MLRFAFRPRHPVTRVAFTANGSEIITAQPFTGIAIRDRLTGEARVTFPAHGAAAIHETAVYLTSGWTGGWLGVRTDRSTQLFDVSPQSQVQPAISLPGFGVNRFAIGSSSTPIVSWFNSTPPSFETWTYPRSSEAVGTWVRDRSGTIRTTGQIHAVSPDARWYLCLRPQTRPLLASLHTGEVAAELNAAVRIRHSPSTLLIEFSASGSKLALGNGELLSVFDLSGASHEIPAGGNRKVLNPLFTLERPDPTLHGTHADKIAEHWLPPVAFDHAGRTMFTLGLRNRVQRIDLATGGVMAEWGWRCEPIRSLAIAPDGLTAAAGCQRGELVLWDLE